MSKLEATSILITGASSGVGRAIAQRFAEQGAGHVVVADVREEPREGGPSTVEIVRAAGASARFVRCDVSNLEQLEQAVAIADQQCGGLTTMVNNAGIYRAENFLEVSEKSYQLMMDINVKGTFFGAQAAARAMLARGNGGNIINICSIAGLLGTATFPTYNASKGAVRLLTLSLADSLGKQGIRVNAVFPGLISTEMTRTDVPTDTPETRQMIPLARAGTPQEVANAVVFLSSDQAAYINGASLAIDGGALRI